MVAIFAKEGPIGTGPYVVESFTKERAELKEMIILGWQGRFYRVKFHPLMDDEYTGYGVAIR